MVNCPNCGTPVDGKFCVKCGLPVSSANPSAPQPGASAPGSYQPPQPAPPPQQNYPPQGSYQQPQQAAPPPGGGYQQQQNYQQQQGGYQQPGQGGGYQQQPGGYQQQPGYNPPPASSGSGLEDNLAGALCYAFGVLSGVLFLVLEPYNKNPWIKFHAFQSLFLNLGMIGVWIALSIISMILAMIPVVGGIVAMLLYFGVFIGFLVLWVMLMMKAYQRQTWVLPVVGPLAQKQAYSN